MHISQSVVFHDSLTVIIQFSALFEWFYFTSDFFFFLFQTNTAEGLWYLLNHVQDILRAIVGLQSSRAELILKGAGETKEKDGYKEDSQESCQHDYMTELGKSSCIDTIILGSLIICLTCVPIQHPIFLFLSLSLSPLPL